MMPDCMYVLLGLAAKQSGGEDKFRKEEAYRGGGTKGRTDGGGAKWGSGQTTFQCEEGRKID